MWCMWCDVYHCGLWSSVYLSVCFSVCPCACLSTRLYVIVACDVSGGDRWRQTACNPVWAWSMHLSLHSIHPPVYLSTHLSVYHCGLWWVRWSVRRICVQSYVTVTQVPVCLFIYLSMYLSVCLSIYLCTCLSTRLSVYLSVHPSTCISACLSIYCCRLYCHEVIGEDKLRVVVRERDPCICLSIHPSVYLSVYLSVHPSTCTSTCLSIYCCRLYCQEVIGEDKLRAVLRDHDPCVCLTVYLAIYLSVCLPVYLSVCLSLWSVMCLEVIGEDKLRVILHVCDPCVCLSNPSIHCDSCCDIQSWAWAVHLYCSA